MATLRSSCSLAITFLALTAFSLPALAQVDGALDETFWFDGKVTLAYPPYLSVTATVVAPDGRLVVVGERYDAGKEETLFWSILDDESLGTPCVPTSPGGGNDFRARAAAFDPQGRLVIAGEAEFPDPVEGFALRYLYPACDLDEGFNLDGVYRTDLGEAGFASIAFDTNSRLVLSGFYYITGEAGLLIVRLAQNGLFDLTFGNFGRVELPLEGSVSHPALAVQPDDRIVVGATILGPATYDFFVVRLDPLGELDGTFGGDGTVEIDIAAGVDDLRALVLDPVSGDILAAGQSGSVADAAFAVVRLESNGAPDASFDDDGIWTDTLWDEDQARSIQLQSDGKILVAGNAVHPGTGDYDFLVYRLMPDGAPDNSFGFLGVAAVSFNVDARVNDQLFATALYAGKLVVAGTNHDPGGSEPHAVVARLWSDLIFTDGFEGASAGGWSSAVGAP